MSITKDRCYWVKRKLCRLWGEKPNISEDQFWMQCMLSPNLAMEFCDIAIPTLPPKDVQLRFTGRFGYENLAQAFHFYKFISEKCELNLELNPQILDFGGGWGRIARFFLRDTVPQNIWVTDVLSDSIDWLKKTNAPYNIIQNNPLPPISEANTCFDLIYAFSVFSHLSEEYFLSWTQYLLSLLSPGGHLVFTTRGGQFLHHLENLQAKGRMQSLPNSLPKASAIRELYAKENFLFYPKEGGGELSEEFYGESFIPKGYLERLFGDQLVVFTEEVKNIDQAVCILKKL